MSENKSKENEIREDNSLLLEEYLKSKYISKNTSYQILDIFIIEENNLIFLVEEILYLKYNTRRYSLKGVFDKSKLSKKLRKKLKRIKKEK